jgi:hypothetical protein
MSNRFRFPLVMIALLIGAALACTLSFESGGSDTPADESLGGSGGGDGIAPSVQIVDPASGARVPRQQRVDITVQTTSTADRFQVNINGRVAITKALPPDQSGPTSAILSWTPDRDGSYTLEVIAFNGAASSIPAILVLEVSGTAAGTTGGVAGCTGKVMVSQLNYRDGAGTAAQQLGQFDVGEVVTIVGRNGDTSWYRVQRANTLQVWVINNTQWLQIEGQCGDLPVVG